MKIHYPIKHAALFAIIFGMTALISACVSVGNSFNLERTEQIRKGVTTKANLIQWFGKPNSITRKGDGTQVLAWIYQESKVKAQSFIPYAGMFMGGADSSGKRLTVTLKNGTVSDYEASGDEIESRSNRRDKERGN
jgi:hypothetical protein